MRSDRDQRSCWLRSLVEYLGLLIERGTFQECPLCGLTSRLGIGRRRVFASLDAVLFLLLVEREQLFVIVRGSGLERVVIERVEHVEPNDVHLIMQEQVVRFDQMNQRNLAVAVRQCYHEMVLRERAGLLSKHLPANSFCGGLSFLLLRSRKEVFCKSLLDSIHIPHTRITKPRETQSFPSGAPHL